MSKRPTPDEYIQHLDTRLTAHRNWLGAVLARVLADDPAALDRGGALHRIWSGGASTENSDPLLTSVPYYSQRDSAQRDQRDRTCFSSSCAMLLEAVKPGTLQGANGDDQYLAVVQRFGDTTDASAQLQALAHFGVKACIDRRADFLLIEKQIQRGIPVPCGYLHRGPVDRPTGSGHWLIVYGHTRTHVVVHDPWGEPDLLAGTTLSPNGEGLRFSRQNFGRRWMVEPTAGGVYRYAPGNGWAIVVDEVL
jgi:hypothetical protein